MKRFYSAIGFLVILFFLFLIGCASKIVPVETISNAEMAINVAKESNAVINAPLELKIAEDKLISARIAVDKEDFENARRLAEQALADAKLAETKSLSIKSKKRAQEMQDSINALKSEIERKQRLQ